MNSIIKAATLTEDEIRTALCDCYDPEIPCNIVDLGLVYGIDVVLDHDAPGAGIPGVPARHRVRVLLTLTTPGCPAHTQIAAQIENRLAAFETISKTEVELVWQPAWSPQRITPEGRARLGLDENGSPIAGEGSLGRRIGFPAKKDKLVQLG